MRISIYGLGYVGAVCTACLAKHGHTVVGVDPNTAKVDSINNGRTPIVEKDVDTLIADGVARGTVRATTDPREAILSTDVSLICVGTPSRPNGSLDLSHVETVSREIGKALKEKDDRHLVVVRSTVLPGTTEELVAPLIEAESGKRAGIDFGVAFNPEFLREGTAVYDFHNPPKTVIGSLGKSDADTVAQLYAGLDAPLFKTPIRVAEMVKYADNVFHALKIVFGNEIGTVCKALDIDSHEVMRIFCKDDKLNLSPYYLMPGFAFGGSCLPKDLRALTFKARSLDVDVPVLNAIMHSNVGHIRSAVNRITALGRRRIGVLGFAFKAGTDDLRESPIVELVETLLGKGYAIKLYDRNVALARLVGANREFLDKHLPHVSQLMVDDIETIVQHAEVIVIGNNDETFLDALSMLRKDQVVIDLVRLTDEPQTQAEYHGICW